MIALLDITDERHVAKGVPGFLAAVEDGFIGLVKLKGRIKSVGKDIIEESDQGIPGDGSDVALVFQTEPCGLPACFFVFEDAFYVGNGLVYVVDDHH